MLVKIHEGMVIEEMAEQAMLYGLSGEKLNL